MQVRPFQVRWASAWACARVALAQGYDLEAGGSPLEVAAVRCLRERQRRRQPLEVRLEYFKARRWADAVLGC